MVGQIWRLARVGFVGVSPHRWFATLTVRLALRRYATCWPLFSLYGLFVCNCSRCLTGGMDMVKSVLSVSHRGLRDWAVQRLTAILMALYTIYFISYFCCKGITFNTWTAFFANTGVKIGSLLILVAVLAHAWVGMWTIFTDYVKPFVLRTLLHTLVLLMLFACFIWGIMILWSV